MGLAEADTLLMKADLAAAIVRILRERGLSGARAAEYAGATESDLSRIRRAALDRFTIDRLVLIFNRLDSELRVRVELRRRRPPSDRAGAVG